MTYPAHPPEPPPLVRVVPSKQLTDNNDVSANLAFTPVGTVAEVSPPEAIAPAPLDPEWSWVEPSATASLPPLQPIPEAKQIQDRRDSLPTLPAIELEDENAEPESEPVFEEIEAEGESQPFNPSSATEETEAIEAEGESQPFNPSPTTEETLEDIREDVTEEDFPDVDLEDDFDESPSLPEQEIPLENPQLPETELDAEPSDPKEPTPSVNGSNLQDPLDLDTPIEVTADYQDFDSERQIFTAVGNVVMRYGNSVLDADWLQVNLLTRMVRAEGDVALNQPNQTLRGDRFRYNFVQDTGTVYQASGEISPQTRIANATPQNAPAAVNAPETTLLPVALSAEGLADAPQSDRIAQRQPLRVTGGGQVNIGIGAGRGYQDAEGGGTINSFRFQAEQIDFTPDGWEGTGVRITNDPFSPPELEIRADRATLRAIDPLRDEILLSRPRLVFDDNFALPILKRRYVIDRRERQDPFLEFGFDGEDRGGFFIQRTFVVAETPRFSVRVAPQYFVQQGYDNRDFGDLENFGAVIRTQALLTPTTTLRAEANITNIDLNNFDADDDLRASARLSQELLGGHTLTGEYSFRNRLFNGSLGFRTVYSSIGAVITSPRYTLGRSGITLDYQFGINRIEADTDKAELLEPIRDNNRISLTRYQGSAVLRRGFTLWQGEPLPATPEAGLRFTPVPVVPFMQVYVGARGIAGFYSNGDSETSLRGTVGFQAQFGNFSRNFLDYTALSVEYSQTLISGESPFPFDREADRQRLQLGLTQQLYGPFRFGIQTSINLDSGENFSTNFVLEYSRRTHGITLLVNPQRELGALTFRISDFDWNGNTTPFSNPSNCQVVGGLRCVR